MMNVRYVFFAIAVALAAVIAMAACGGEEPAAEPTPTEAPAPTPTPVPPTPTPEPTPTEASEGTAESTGEAMPKDEGTPLDPALLERVTAALGQQAQMSAHFELDASIRTSFSGIPLNIPIKLSGDFQPPDRSHATLSVNLSFVAFQSETIVIGNDVYSLNPTSGLWERINATATLFSGPSQVMVPVLQALPGLTLIGQETLGTTAVLHLRLSDVPGLFGPVDRKATADLFVGVDDLVLHQVQVTGEIQLAELGQQFAEVGATGPAAVDAIVRSSDYGKAVDIQAPKVPKGVTSMGGKPGIKQEAQARYHIDFGESHPKYNSVPATSGWHYAQPNAPVAWGVYKDFLPDEVLLHNLEHGGIGIHYNCPDGCSDMAGQLAEFASKYPKIVVSPYPGMETLIALTAWTYLDKFDEFDAERITDFIEAHINSPDSPEPFAP
jgi:hypothetical protein